MRKKVDKLFAQYGTDMIWICGKTEKTVRGFFRAVTANGWQSIESEASLLGEITRGRYIYIGPAEAGAKEGDVLMLGGRSYLMRRVESFYCGNSTLYQWALCVEKGVNDTWGAASHYWNM